MLTSHQLDVTLLYLIMVILWPSTSHMMPWSALTYIWSNTKKKTVPVTLSV